MLAHRIRGAVKREIGGIIPSRAPVSISIGIADCNALSQIDREELLFRADGALYQAKNGVCMADYEAAGGDVDCGQLPSGAKPVQVPSGSSDPYDMDGDHDGIGCERG